MSGVEMASRGSQGIQEVLAQGMCAWLTNECAESHIGPVTFAGKGVVFTVNPFQV